MAQLPVTIASLIYASPKHALALWNMVKPELKDGARFFFVANDASADVLDCLEKNHIPYVRQDNKKLTDAELEAIGIGKPEYLRRVYQGWNRAVLESKTDCVVLISSDHVLRPGWLSTLYRHWRQDLALSALTIEPRGRNGIFPNMNGTGAIAGEHGRTLDSFDADAFEKHAAAVAADTFTDGGAHQPLMVSRMQMIRAGLYPEGNLHAGKFDKIADYGDRRLFRRLKENGVRHRTCHAVVAYHFQEGEMREHDESILTK